MAIRVQRHANVSKQATLLDGLDVSPLKWRACGCGLNRFVHEGMNHISNVEVHLKTRSGNVNFCKMSFLHIHAQIALCLRNRFALAVICCLIYHWLEVSR